MNCEECLSPSRENANYCWKCGRKLRPATCPACGTEIEPTARFCSICGNCLLVQEDYAQLNTSPKLSRQGEMPRSDILFGTADAERKFVTVLFADAVNYTAMADRLDPEDVHQVIGGCFRTLYDLVRQSDGIVTAFSGDGLMALFGAPIAREDHAQRACHSALSMQDAIAAYSKDVQERYGAEFAIRIGINSGSAIVGTMGHGYTALGDTVNVGSRLQSLASPGTVIVSKDTYRLVRHFFAFETLGPATLKGKKREVEAYRLIEPIRLENQAPAGGVTGPAIFVGRRDELRRLRNAFNKVESGAGQVIALVGEAGVGKSTLIRQFRDGLSSRDHLYLEGECLHFGSPIAYLPVLGILRSFFGLSEGIGESSARTRIDERLAEMGLDRASAASSIRELFSLSGEGESFLGLSPKQKRDRIFEAVEDLLVRISEEKTLVLVIENLLWIDRTSEDFLAYLVPRLVNTRIMLILVYRPEYRSPFDAPSHVVSIFLGGLDETEGPRIIEALLEDQQVSSPIRDFIMARARGNPLFIEELTRSLKENGYIHERHGEHVLRKKLLEITVPNTIQGIVTARIDRLSEIPKRLLQTAAVVGKTFAPSILRRIVGEDPKLEIHLLELQALEFIVSKPIRGETRYEFRHDLLHEVAYNSMLVRRRKELHEAVASAIEVVYADEIQEFYEILAHHLSKSGNTAKAYKYLKLSANKATQGSCLWEGFCYCREALDVLKREPISPGRSAEELELYLLMVSPMISIGFPEDSLELLRAGELLARELNSVRHIATFSSVVGLCYSVRGELKEGQKYTEECFRAAVRMGDIEVIAPTAFDLCSNYAARGEFLKLRQAAAKVIPWIEREKREADSFDRGYNIYAALLGFWGFSEGYLGKFEDGEALCNKGLRFCEEIQNLAALGMLETCLGYVLAHRGDGFEAIPHFLKSIKYLEKGHISVLLGLAWSGLGWAHYFVGKLGLAQRHIEKGLAIHSAAGIEYKSSIPYWFLAHVLLEQGKTAKSKECAEEALNRARKNDEVYVEGISRMLIGMTTSGADNPRGAEEHLRAGIESLAALEIVPFYAIGNLYLAVLYKNLGRTKMALKKSIVARSVFEKTGMIFWLKKLSEAFPG
jgi:class 3 adenylate cyclase/tetratricopeptide (TPR) repeat protein